MTSGREKGRTDNERKSWATKKTKLARIITFAKFTEVAVERGLDSTWYTASLLNVGLPPQCTSI
ncbi:hypothetical protein M404DRAFT_996574 [Pisolithus tinctorius Marx 270]|uniref:Uncharacterized protein n=1 Tax=Pisolithus tinctorius Marx 270 TaxID=870435 RepID=A0A0C3KJH5_PISTI|nr:hypothetical protein M404DRAFT_996574 [Pisolithus tinctorius Marx 270]